MPNSNDVETYKHFHWDYQGTEQTKFNSIQLAQIKVTILDNKDDRGQDSP